MTSTETVRCSCGATLLDEVDGREVVIGDDRFQFARTTDFIACESCGHLHRVTDLKSGENPAITDAVDELSRLNKGGDYS